MLTSKKENRKEQRSAYVGIQVMRLQKTKLEFVSFIILALTFFSEKKVLQISKNLF